MNDVRYPFNWQQVSLGDICYINKYSLSEKTSKEYKFKYIDLSSVDKGNIVFPNQYILFKDAPSRARRLINRNDIIMSTVRPNLKGFALINFDSSEFICSTGFAVLTAKERTSNRYIYQLLFSKEIEMQIKNMLVGSSYPAINSSDVASLKIFLPPLAEQEKIADILGTWDEAIEKLSNLIEQKKLLKKGLMQKLLTGKTRLSGFTQPWKEVKCKEFLKERKTYLTKGAELEHVSLTKEGVVPKTDRYNRDFLVKQADKEYKITKLHDICYNPANLKFGVICLNTYGEGIFSPIYVTYEIVNGNAIFLGYLLTTNDFITKARRYEEGTVYERMAVSSEDFQQVKVFIPSDIAEQQAIADVLSTADDEINLLNQELEALKVQKKGLMQKLLTGQIRVKVN